MPRTVSAAFLEQALKEHASDYLELVTLDHADLGAPLRFYNGQLPYPQTTVASNGNDFTAARFEAVWPGDGEDSPTGKLRIANIDRTIGETLLAISSPISVRIDLALPDTPDSYEVTFDGFELRNVRWNALAVEGEISVDGLSTEPWPKRVVTPTFSPGFFKR